MHLGRRSIHEFIESLHISTHTKKHTVTFRLCKKLIIWFLQKHPYGLRLDGLSLLFRIAGGNVAAGCEIIAPRDVKHANTSVFVTDCPTPCVRAQIDAGNNQETLSGVCCCIWRAVHSTRVYDHWRCVYHTGKKQSSLDIAMTYGVFCRGG